MPIIYLSPSTQEFNPYVTTGNEEYWMNRLADAMEPMLTASGIQFHRNTPDMTAASSIRASNAGNYDLHLALHSNAAGAGNAGRDRGILAFYFPGSPQGQRAAQLIVDELKAIYPLPNLVRTEATTTLGEVRRVRAPAV
ncbi:MAG: N-acetylmuramoyl-L-alanine amidase, partial [Ruminiclostridium sp.]|nr:N-acetylmuramoyl-L-alanine amidase [Ruminiclostridium sp.]